MSYYQYREPHSSRFLLALRRLTIVKLIIWIIRLVGRGGRKIGKILLVIPRFFGWFFLDIAYGLKNEKLEWQEKTTYRRSFLVATISFIFSALWLIPRSIGNFFRRVERVGATASVPSSFKEARIRESGYKPPLAWSLVNFCLTLLVIISPIVIYSNWRWLETVKEKVLGSGVSAIEQLLSAQEFLGEQKPAEAQQAFSEAGKNFLQAQSDLSHVNSFLLTVAGLIPHDSARLAGSSKHLVRAGQLSSELGEILSGALILPPGQTPTALTVLQNFLTQAEKSLPVARELEKEVSKIDKQALPTEYHAQFSDLTTKVRFLVTSLEESIALGQQISGFLGEKMDKRYMLVFQNNAEKRGPGGFVGSFAIVDIRRGEITRLTVPKGGTYDTEAGLSRLVASPEPLRLLNPRWHFWDANWWPDWPTSARKLMWFYEHSNGPTVDGVISLTPTVLERVLEIVGPVDMTKDYGVVIDAQNFWTVTQTFSEQKPDVTKEPKKIIGDLMNRLMEEFPKRLTPEKTVALIGVLEQALNEKLMLAYVNDEELQQTITKLDWGGEIKKTNGDFLMVINSNIGGQKTDRVIEESLTHEARILTDGSIVDTLTIRRHHPAQRGETFIGVRNVDWLRVYVPEGSTLLSASGFRSPDKSLFELPDPRSEQDPALEAEENALIDYASGTKIYAEQGKTVFANWSMLDPGETEVITLTYRLPFTRKPISPRSGFQGWLDSWLKPQRSLDYSLLVQKQPGAVTTNLHSLLTIEGSPVITWNYPSEYRATQGWNISRPLTTDFFGALLYNQRYD